MAKKINTELFLMVLYTSVCVFLFIYALPLIYIGFASVQPEGDIPVANRTVTELAAGLELSPITKGAVWFAQEKHVRLVIAIVLILLTVVITLTTEKKQILKNYCQVVNWLCLGIFIFNYLGLVCLLLVI